MNNQENVLQKLDVLGIPYEIVQFILHMCLFRAMPKQMARASSRVYIY